MEVKGDMQVKRTGIFDRRADQGLRQATIVGADTLTRHSAWWQSLSAAAPQDVNLPDATTLPNGWAVVVFASGASDLTVKDNGGTTIHLVESGNAYEFFLVDNGDADGTWYVNFLEISSEVPALRYTMTHNAVADWGAAVGGYYTITITEATHEKGTSPVPQYYETSGADQIEVIPDRSLVNASGDVSFRVPDSPDLRYAGKVIII